MAEQQAPKIDHAATPTRRNEVTPMAEQAVDAGFIARYERLANALRGVELSRHEDEILRLIAAARHPNLASLDDDDLWTLAELIERARLAGPGGSSRTEVLVSLPGKHRKEGL